MSPRRSASLLISVLAALSLAGCGGGSSSDTPVKKTAVSGSAVAGAIDGTVVVRDAGGNQVATGVVVGGDFSLQVPDSALDGELDFTVTGTYTDEVSGNDVTLDAGHPLALRLAANTVTAGTAATIGITPETTVIRELVKHQGMTLSDALTTYAAELGNTPDGSGRPYDPTVAAPSWADDAANDVTYRVGSYSQLGTDLGLSGNDLAALPGALAADLADGALDGLNDSGNDVSIGSMNLRTLHQASALAARYMTAMATFDSSAANAAGVPEPSMGLPPNAKITEAISKMTSAERIVDVGGTDVRVSVTLSPNTAAPFSSMGPITGRNVYRVTLTKVSDGSPIDVTAVGSPVTSIKASSLMHMMGMSHGTPMTASYDATTSNPAIGAYDFKVYYVMASAMSMGGMMSPMGIWDLDFTLNNTSALTARFHPNVAMSMGSTLSSRGASDHGGRMYWVWLDSVASAGGGHDLSLFLTTKVGMMFPAAFDGASYSAMSDSLDINTVSVQVSTDGGVTWSTDLTGDGAGHYSLAGLAGLSTASAGNLVVKVTVTTDDAVVHSIKQTNGSDPTLTFQAP